MRRIPQGWVSIPGAWINDLLEGIKKLETENAALRDRIEALEWLVECYDVESQNISQTYEAYIEMLASLDAAREAIR
ncbi:hypothetical protein [Desulfovibrio falkowii]|uniref:Uncharacterized protein n=1 Tax=Desulfovibrio falkowii TaxID=3136602 RepID=A0ABQ0E9P8_9BACT